MFKLNNLKDFYREDESVASLNSANTQAYFYTNVYNGKALTVRRHFKSGMYLLKYFVEKNESNIKVVLKEKRLSKKRLAIINKVTGNSYNINIALTLEQKRIEEIICLIIKQDYYQIYSTTSIENKFINLRTDYIISKLNVLNLIIRQVFNFFEHADDDTLKDLMEGVVYDNELKYVYMDNDLLNFLYIGN